VRLGRKMPRPLIDWGMLGQWLEMGRALKRMGEEAHAFTSQFRHIFQAKTKTSSSTKYREIKSKRKRKIRKR